MKSDQNTLSPAFVRELKAATTGYLLPEDFNKLLLSFENEIAGHYFPLSAEVNLHRIIFSLFDRISFLRDCVKFPHYIQIVVSIAVNSNYLTDIIIRNPEILYWIISPDNLSGKITTEYLKQNIRDSLSRYKTFTSKVNLLRLIKRREILRIGVNDILGNATLVETTKQLSILAKVINDELFELCYSETLNKYNIRTRTERYCLAALGKLGGDELNYSSDVDFILFFDKNTTIGRNPAKEYYEILTEATHLFIQTSTAVTDKGYIYRVDFRLRPDGRNSPLCRTLKDYIQYYDSRGEEWERQMLIKLSFVGGNKKLYDTFNNYVQHFTYPSSFTVSPLEQITVMKGNIEKNMGSRENVKLFSGGIRDIEFAVQALQLLNGGRLKDLRTGSTLEAIDRLTSHGLLSSDEAAVLIPAYIFYRRIEHYLQLMNDTQTHVIPKDEEILNKLSRFLGYKNVSAFQNKLEHSRKDVRTIFNSITGQKPKAKSFSVDELTFSDPKRTINNYRYLQSGQGLLDQKLFDKQTINAFQEIEEGLIKYLKHSFAPDLLLDNFSRIIKTRPLPSIWYHEFRDPVLFNAFLKICEQSQRAVDLTVMDKSLGDLILGRRIFIKDTEQFNVMTINQVLFILSIQFTLGFLSHKEISKILAGYISAQIADISDGLSLAYRYFIIGMGSFGSRDLTFTSDIDIVILADEAGLQLDTQKDFQVFLEKLTGRIAPLEIDSRLRPEGKSGQLVWDVNSYCDYLDKRAQTWELQSLTKVRFISGDNALFNSLESRIKSRIDKINHGQLKTDILEMRRKINKQLMSSPQSSFNNFFNIKKSRGGLTDIDFALQYMMLNDARLFNKFSGKSISKILSQLVEFSDNLSSFASLKNSYSFLKMLELKIQIMFNSGSSVLPLDESKRFMLAKACGLKDTKELEEELYRINRQVSDFFDTVVQ